MTFILRVTGFTSVRRGALLHNKIQMSYMYMMLWYDEFIM